METHEPIIFHKKRDFTELFNAVFEFLRQELKPFFKRLLILVLPVQIILNIIAGYSTWGDPTAFEISSEHFGTLSIMIIVNFLFALIFISVVYSYLEEYIFDDIAETGMFKRALGVFGRILPMSLLSVVFIFIFIVIFMIFGGLLTGVFGLLSPIIGALFLIISLFFGFFLITPLSFMYIIKVAEHTSAIDTFARCYQLIKGYWWKNFGSLLLFFIIQTVFILVFELPAYYMSEIADLLGINYLSDGLPLYIIGQIINSCSLFFSTFIFIYLAFQYFNLLERKEAPSLDSMVDELKADEGLSSDDRYDSGRDTTDDEIKYGPKPGM